MYKIFRFLEKYHKDSMSFKNVILSPIFIILEFIAKFKIWKRVIVKEMITNDTIFNFLNDEDFEYTKGKFIKKDTIEDSRYSVYNNDISNIRRVIRYDYVTAMSNVLKNTPFDVENYVSLIVDIEPMYVKDQIGNYHHSNVYSVIIQYIRNTYIKTAARCLLTLIAALVAVATLLIIISTIIAMI